MQWRTILGLFAKQAAVDYAVEKSWMIVEEGCSVRVTDEGCSLVRRGMLYGPAYADLSGRPIRFQGSL
jgi:hypothetical protein